MRERWGEVFPLGGLAGIPFTGVTGWGAFSHHVPKDGNIVVLYAPHVGITADGVVGKVHRPGQDHATSACGASIGAYNLLSKDDTSGRRLKGDKKYNRQMEYIIEALKPVMKKVMASDDSNERMTKLAYETYTLVEEMLFDIIDRKWMDTESKLVLLGGIMINVDGEASDLFIPLNFEVQRKDGSVDDLMEKVFGELASKHTKVALPEMKWCEKGETFKSDIDKCVPC